jgi:hypothetical protein
VRSFGKTLKLKLFRQCLLDESTQVALSLACPACDNSIVSTSPGPQPHILVRYHNEGGIQTNLDILPLITEEAYLESNPAARPARAFMTSMYALGLFTFVGVPTSCEATPFSFGLFESYSTFKLLTSFFTQCVPKEMCLALCKC